MVKDLTGMRFGKITVIGYEGAQKSGKFQRHLWKCRCDCGTEFITEHWNLLSGNTKSCGCLRSERSAGWCSSKEFSESRTRIKITLNGETHSVREWSEITGIKRNRIYDLYKRGLPAEKILSNG